MGPYEKDAALGCGDVFDRIFNTKNLSPDELG
jgi:hypothetical protein